jgi:hypothetical protein
MSDTDTSARPRQLTMAGGFVIGGSALLVLSVFDTITNLHSVATHDEISKVLTSSTGESLGLSLDEALSAMRVGLMVAAACAAATVVLGVYALQRSRPARLALSVLAVPILLTAPLTGGLLGALVAAAILLLWSGQARDWFDGKPVRQLDGPSAPRQQRQGPWEQNLPPGDHRQPPTPGTTPPPVDRPAPPVGPPAGWQAPPASSLTTSGPSSAPGATTGFGERAIAPTPGAWMPPTYAQVTQGDAVPVTVKVACVLTWVFSGVVSLMYAGVLVVLAADQDRMVDYIVKAPEWQRANLDQDLLVPVLWVACLMFLAWSLGACVLAWFTWRRHNWARWMLAVSAGVALVAALFAFPVGLLHQLAAALTIAGLFSAAARSWFTPQPWTPGPPSGPPTGPEHDQHQGQSQGQGQPPPPGGKPPVW